MPNPASTTSTTVVSTWSCILLKQSLNVVGDYGAMRLYPLQNRTFYSSSTTLCNNNLIHLCVHYNVFSEFFTLSALHCSMLPGWRHKQVEKRTYTCIWIKNPVWYWPILYNIFCNIMCLSFWRKKISNSVFFCVSFSFFYWKASRFQTCNNPHYVYPLRVRSILYRFSSVKSLEYKLANIAGHYLAYE